MKALKFLMLAVLGIVVVASIVLVIGFNNLDKIIKTTVEGVGPRVVGTEVTLNDVELTLSEGRAELNGLSVANPVGFSAANALWLGSIALDIDTSSLTKPVVVIEEIQISDMNVLAEQANLLKTNIEALLENVKRNTAQSRSEVTENKGDQPKEGQPEKEILLAVKKFTFEQSDLAIKTQKWGDINIKLPVIALKNLGSASKGLTAQQLAQTVMESLLSQIKKQVGRELEGLAKEKLKEEVETQLKGRLKEKFSDSDREKLKQLKSLFK